MMDDDNQDTVRIMKVSKRDENTPPPNNTKEEILLT